MRNLNILTIFCTVLSTNGLEIFAHMSEGIKSWRNDVFRPSVRGLVNAAQLFGFT